MAVAVVAVALVGGVGAGVAVKDVRADDGPAPRPSTSAASTSRSATPSSPAGSALLPPEKMQVMTGAVGPIGVGFTPEQAAETGYFDTDEPSETCDGIDILRWKKPWSSTFDVLLGADGNISAIGVTKAGPRTRSGLEVGSSYAEVRKVLGPGAEPSTNDYGQTTLFAFDGHSYIGFLFDPSPAEVTDESKVVFMEVTSGTKPGLLRDGC